MVRDWQVRSIDGVELEEIRADFAGHVLCWYTGAHTVESRTQEGRETALSLSGDGRLFGSIMIIFVLLVRRCGEECRGEPGDGVRAGL